MMLKEPAFEQAEDAEIKLSAVPGLFRLVDNIRAVPGVRRIGWRVLDHEISLWVLLERRNAEATERIVEFKYDYLQKYATKGALPLELHVSGLEKIKSWQLPPFDEEIEVPDVASA